MCHNTGRAERCRKTLAGRHTQPARPIRGGSMTVTLSEDELCPCCQQNFMEDFEAAAVHSYFYNIDVYIHQECWDEFLLKAGNAQLDFMQPANQLPI